jgi:hypothetical protein
MKPLLDQMNKFSPDNPEYDKFKKMFEEEESRIIEDIMRGGSSSEDNLTLDSLNSLNSQQKKIFEKRFDEELKPSLDALEGMPVTDDFNPKEYKEQAIRDLISEIKEMTEESRDASNNGWKTIKTAWKTIDTGWVVVSQDGRDVRNPKNTDRSNIGGNKILLRSLSQIIDNIDSWVTSARTIGNVISQMENGLFRYESEFGKSDIVQTYVDNLKRLLSDPSSNRDGIIAVAKSIIQEIGGIKSATPITYEEVWTNRNK